MVPSGCATTTCASYALDVVLLQGELRHSLLGRAPCLPSSQGVGPVVMKNWDPLVLGPALAMERTPVACLTLKFSSANFLP
jgi:hypothetical protein